MASPRGTGLVSYVCTQKFTANGATQTRNCFFEATNQAEAEKIVGTLKLAGLVTLSAVINPGIGTGKETDIVTGKKHVLKRVVLSAYDRDTKNSSVAFINTSSKNPLVTTTNLNDIDMEVALKDATPFSDDDATKVTKVTLDVEKRTFA